MTTAQMNAELLYHASLSPFKTMREKGIISEVDYLTIDTILQAKYSPLFVGRTMPKSLDNTAQ